MTRTQKYNLRFTVDQFGNPVRPDFEDKDERALIDQFEAKVTQLAVEKQGPLSMIELGSNQAYYTALFNRIVGAERARNVCVDTGEFMLNRSREQLGLNGITATFVEGAIGRLYGPTGEAHNLKLANLSGIIDEHLGGYCDVLHCDIDGGEVALLCDHADAFRAGKVGLLFLLAHRGIGVADQKFSDHEWCIYRMTEIGGYDLVWQSAKDWRIAGDNLLIYKLRK